MKAVRLIGFHSQGIFNPADKRRETDGSDDVVFDPTLDIAQHPLSRWLPNEQDLAMKMIFKSTLAAALLAGAAEDRAHQLPDVGIVLGDQDPGVRHAAFIPASPAGPSP